MRDRPVVSYTELEHETAEEVGIPGWCSSSTKDILGPDLLVDDLYGDRQFSDPMGECGVTVATVISPADLETQLLQALTPSPTRYRTEALRQPGTLRYRLIRVPGRLIRHAHGLTLRLPPSHRLLEAVLARALPARNALTRSYRP